MSNENTEDLDLEFTRAKRKEIVEALTPKGKVPTDLKEISTILNALDGMDRASLSKKKIKSDEGIGDKNLQAVEVLSRIFTDPRLKGIGSAPADPNRVIPTLSDDLVLPMIMPGELDQIGPTENYESFMARVAPKE